MIPPSQRSLALNYEDLKNRFLSGIPDNFNIEEIKTNFRNISNILSRRRLGRIRDLSELLWRCEENLLILPETGEINLFQEIVSLVRDLNMHHVSPSTWEEVRMLDPAWRPAPATVGCLTPVPPQVVTKLIVRLTAAGTGRDWDHFSRALGTGLDREDDIKLKEGDLCRLERKYGDNLGALLRHVIREFERKCLMFGVKVDTTHHIQDILRTERILYDHVYYTALAHDLREERLRLVY